jgi:SSS family solute:Na+ symporter
VAAMGGSFAISVVFILLKKSGYSLPFAHVVLYEVGFTTVCWLAAAFLCPPTSRERLVGFYKKTHPAGPGWTKIRIEAGVSESDAALHGDHMGLAALGWISGCLTIWSSLFAIGNFLYGRMNYAWMLSGLFVISGSVLLYVINHLWAGAASPQITSPVPAPDLTTNQR